MSTSRPLSIRWWLGGLVAGVGVPLLILLVWMYGLQVRRERLESREQALRIATSAAARIQELHRESTVLMERIALRPAVREFDGQTCDSAFVVIDVLPQYADLFLVDAGGSIVCAATPGLKDRRTSALARQWVTAELRSGMAPRTRQAKMRLVDSRWIGTLTVPVTAPDGAVRGTLVLVQLPEGFGEETLPAGSVITILDSAGTVVARSTASHDWTGRNVRHLGITEIALREKTGVTEAKGLDGVSRQYAFQHLPDLGWYLYVGIPTSVIMQPVRRTYSRGITGGVVIVLILAIVATMLSRQIQRPLALLAKAAAAATRGSYGEVPTAEGPREVTALATSFNHMVRARTLSQARMHDDEQKMKALSERLLVVQEEERSRIARELHDDLGQALTALKMDVIGLLEKSNGPSPVADRILRTLDHTVTSVQRISSELRPSMLDDLGLVAAIEAEARLFEERTGIECELSLPENPSLDGREVTAIYRIVQEALTNVARHSNASRVEIRLRERAGELLLEIRDDGRGMTEEQAGDRTSFGLIGMRERADLVGATLVLEGVPDRGTIVSMRIPKRPQPEEQS